MVLLEGERGQGPIRRELPQLELVGSSSWWSVVMLADCWYAEQQVEETSKGGLLPALLLSQKRCIARGRAVEGVGGHCGMIRVSASG